MCFQPIGYSFLHLKNLLFIKNFKFTVIISGNYTNLKVKISDNLKSFKSYKTFNMASTAWAGKPAMSVSRGRKNYHLKEVEYFFLTNKQSAPVEYYICTSDIFQ